jgi:hypothetical protein
MAEIVRRFDEEGSTAEVTVKVAGSESTLVTAGQAGSLQQAQDLAAKRLCEVSYGMHLATSHCTQGRRYK